MKTQGLKRRLATDEILRDTTKNIVTERNGRHAMSSWRFDKTKAQEKFPVLYGKLEDDGPKLD